MSIYGQAFLTAFVQRHRDDRQIEVRDDPDRCFRMLERRFPVVGSKIDWGQVPGAVVRQTDPTNPVCEATDAATILSDVARDESLSEAQIVIVIGDSAMEQAMAMPFATLRVSIRELLELPQHLYVMPEDASWCFSFTMEGDLAFGRATSP
jgi:hypothetical protein